MVKPAGHEVAVTLNRVRSTADKVLPYYYYLIQV